ncbi:MAG: hypothetical protein EON95_09705 [Caulobacteraceae bacterium]|nr:MAG: hypothetical protein EON95_09705 [Caulobacteraceae bacterium]
MRILPLLLVGAGALLLSGCGDAKPRRPADPKTQASADCCCKALCPTPADGRGATVVGTLEQEGATGAATGQGRRVGASAGRGDSGQVRRVAHERHGYRHRGRSGTEGVGYLDEDLAGDAHGYRRYERSGTEGVGYLDEDAVAYRGDGYRDGAYRGGGYRDGGYRDGGYRGRAYSRVGGSVSVEDSETYEESRRSSESGYRYSSSGGYEAYESEGGYGGGHRRHGRRGGGGYAGIDRDGYLTWPGKTE